MIASEAFVAYISQPRLFPVGATGADVPQTIAKQGRKCPVVLITCGISILWFRMRKGCPPHRQITLSNL